VREWPVFRGNPLQTGVASSPLPDKLETCWSFATKDAIEGTAAIAQGTVFIGSLDEHLYAIDLATGREKWKFKAGPIKAPAAYKDGAVYAGNQDGMFYCVDAATGQPRWKYEAGAEITSGANFNGDKILFGSGDENLYCLSSKGQLIWKFKVAGGPVLGTPAVTGDRTFVSGCDSSLHFLDVNTGKELAEAVNLDGQTGASGAVAGDFFYVGTMTNQVLAINWKKGEVAWRYESVRRQKPFYASAAVIDNVVIAASRDKHVYAIDRATGKEIWSCATGDRVDSSPVVAGKRVYAGSMDGSLYVLDLDKGTELQRLPLGKAIIGSPAVGENRLVIGTEEGVVYCLGRKN
jgi:outer membrane protein assembly factor BamB